MPSQTKKTTTLPFSQDTGLVPHAYTLYAGVDEAGRGSLAGPVVASAVILPPLYDLPGLGDSKALSAAQREVLTPRIQACALAWSIGVIWPAEIDQVNILQATFRAMSRAVCTLKKAPEQLIIDGNKTIPPVLLRRYWCASHSQDLPRQTSLIKGDALMPAISAASILAKTYRDKLMCALDKRWPGYNFAVHKGYGTREHLCLIQKLGPCPQHRMTFAGVKPLDAPTLRQGLLC